MVAIYIFSGKMPVCAQTHFQVQSPYQLSYEVSQKAAINLSHTRVHLSQIGCFLPLLIQYDIYLAD